MNTKTLLLACGLLMAGTPALAQTAPAQPATPTEAPTLESMFNTWDANHDQALSLDEFKAGWARVAQADALQRLKGQFDAHDQNHNGSLDSAEYAALELVKQFGASAPPLSQFDADRSGSLDFKEYLNFVGAMAKRQPPRK